MNNEHFIELRKIRNVVNLYFNLKLEDNIRDSAHVKARIIYLKLLDDYYGITRESRKEGVKAPIQSEIVKMMGLTEYKGRTIKNILSLYSTYPDLDEHYHILKHYVIKNNDKYPLDDIKKLLVEGKLTLTDVIDAVIDLNKLIGVGLISLGQGLNDYCKSKIIIRDDDL